DNYGFTPYATGPITVVSQSKSSATVNTRLSTTDTVIYNVGSVGSGTLTLQAGSSMATDSGYYNVTVTPPPYQVTVSPHGGTTPNRITGNAYSESFTVTNGGGNSDTYTLTCIGSNITCGALSPAGPIQLVSNQQQSVTVNYTAGA